MPLKVFSKPSWCAGLLLALGACHSPEAEGVTEAVLHHVEAPAAEHAADSSRSSDPPVLGPHHSPILVTLRGPEQPAAGQDITLVAEIDQTLGQGRDVSLELKLPRGARLISGKTSELVNADQGKLERRFVVHLDGVPDQDIELVASTNQRSFGARAKSAYRFGRPEPRLPDLKRAVQPLYVSGRNVGRPIELR
jgi:hypothetical protein